MHLVPVSKVTSEAENKKAGQRTFAKFTGNTCDAVSFSEVAESKLTVNNNHIINLSTISLINI